MPPTSLNFNAFFHSQLLALQLPAHGHRILHLGDVAVSGPRCRGIPCCFRNSHIPQFRNQPSACRVCQWALDERGRVPCFADHLESILEICFPLY